MSEIEFVLIAVSMVLALTMTRLLDTLYHSLSHGKISWIFSLWVINRFIALISLFWAFKGGVMRNSSYNMIEFLVMLGPPVTLYLQAVALAGNRMAYIDDSEAHFLEIRRRFFALGILVATTIATALTVVNVPGTGPAAFLVNISLFAIALSTPRKGVQATVVVIQTALLTAAVAIPVAQAW